jgi:methyltransferase (TIGR00027 family)
MSDERPSIDGVADTAWWTAVYRARETERPDALFRDPLARRLAGGRGAELEAAAERDKGSEWSLVVRTLLFDELILDEIARGADAVVSLAAGLDTRPYRLKLPPKLRWVEVDLPALVAYKDQTLEGEKPACVLERVALDLTDQGARRVLFDDLSKWASAPLLVSEGLLVYLTADQVAGLARDLATPPNFRRWILDVVSPGLLRLMDRHFGADLERTGSALRFAPEEGPRFFERHGWRAAAVRSLLKTGARAKRVPLRMRLLAMLPEPTNRQGSWPWSGVCLMERLEG